MSNIEKLKARYDLVEEVSKTVKLTKRGNEWFGLCPFHSEDTPSFKVNGATGKFHCFGCGKKGDVIDWLRDIEGKDLLAGNNDDSHSNMLNDALELYTKMLLAGGAQYKYINDRKIPDHIVDKFQLGYAPNRWDFIATSLGRRYSQEELVKEGLCVKRNNGSGVFDAFRNRIVFPVFTGRGILAGFSCRTIAGDDPAKYLNSKKTSLYKKDELLYGLHLAKNAIVATKTAIIVEGNFDVLSMHAKGKVNTVSPCGTALTEKHIKQLAKITNSITILYDGDEAGKNASIKLAVMCLNMGLKCRIASLPYGEDPASYIQKGNNIDLILSSSVGSVDYLCNMLTFDCNSADDKINAIAKIDSFLAENANKDVAEIIKGECRKILGIDAVESGKVEYPESINALDRFALFFPEYREIIRPHASTELLKGICRATAEYDIDARFRGITDKEIAIGNCFAEPEYELKSFADVIDFISDDSSDSKTIKIPLDIVRGGGLIDLGLDGLLCDGLPKQWQLSLPAVLATIGAAVCPCISAAGVTPNLYACRIATSGGGKSDIDRAIREVLFDVGAYGFIGPEKFASGSAIINTLQKQNNMLSFLDEVTAYLSSRKGADREMHGIVKDFLELYWQSGSKLGYRNVYASSENNKSLDWFSFSFVGNATPNLLEYLTQDSIGSGLIARTDIFCFLDRPRPRGLWKGPNKKLEQFAQGIYHLNQRQKKNDKGVICPIELSTELIESTLLQVEEITLAKVGDDYKNNTVQALYNKIFKAAIKYALIHHAANKELYNLYTPIELESIEWGIKISEALADWKVKKLIPSINYGEFDNDCQVFLDGLAACWKRKLAGKEGNPTKKGIASKRRAARNWPPQRWSMIIEALVDTGDIRIDGDYILPAK
jgi:DNA primase catalytic core